VERTAPSRSAGRRCRVPGGGAAADAEIPNVVVGIRPEALDLASDGIAARVEVVEGSVPMPTSSASRICRAGRRSSSRASIPPPARAGARVFLQPRLTEGAALPSRHGRKARLMTRIARQPDGLPAGGALLSGRHHRRLCVHRRPGRLRRAGRLVAGGIAAQTRQALENLMACLAAAGCTMDDVVKVTAFLVDLEDFAGYNEVYADFFTEPYPARTTVGVALPGGLLVEIEAVARIP
jgi:reactive intermediate/imine deaminase